MIPPLIVTTAWIGSLTLGIGLFVPLNFALVIYLKNRDVTRVFAGSLTMKLLMISIALLIPVTAIALIPTITFLTSFSITFAIVQNVFHRL